MTTNVFDGRICLLASDSRWSWGSPDGAAFFFVDDTSFAKIVARGDTGIIFAGDSGVIGQWKAWLAAPTQAVPSSNGIAAMIVDLDAKKLIYSLGPIDFAADAAFAGSGKVHAKACWLVNSCAKTAVESAKLKDVCSGGSVMFYNAGTGANNLAEADSCDPKSISGSLQSKGYIMVKTNTGAEISTQCVPVKDAMNDPGIRQMAEQIMNGDVKMIAPCPDIPEAWSDTERAGFEKVMADRFLPKR